MKAKTPFTFAGWFSGMAGTWLSRLAALFDGSAWVLIAPALAWMWFRDPPLVKSIVEWTLLFFVLAGLSVIVSRIAFPQIKLSEHLKKAVGGSISNAIVVAALIIFVAWTIQTMATWARPVGTLAGG